VGLPVLAEVVIKPIIKAVVKIVRAKIQWPQIIGLNLQLRPLIAMQRRQKRHDPEDFVNVTE